MRIIFTYQYLHVLSIEKAKAIFICNTRNVLCFKSLLYILVKVIFISNINIKYRMYQLLYIPAKKYLFLIPVKYFLLSALCTCKIIFICNTSKVLCIKCCIYACKIYIMFYFTYLILIYTNCLSIIYEQNKIYY